jgi:predicted nucleotidyltransferase
MLRSMDGPPVKLILEIAAKHGVSDLRVFGSRARGDARPDSDLDLLMKPGPDTTLLTMAALKRELEEILGISVEVATEGSIRPSHRDRVMRDAKPLVAA